MITQNSIKNAILSYFKQNGKTPTPLSGDATRDFGFPVTWASVNTRLKQGTGGLPGGNSLAKIKTELGLTETRIPLSRVQEAMDAHRKSTGRFPSFGALCQRMGRTVRYKKDTPR